MSKRLSYDNLYSEYPDLGGRVARKRVFLQSLLQDDYGEAYDCTITSLACIFGAEHYGEIEAIAKRYGYDGKKCGTSPLTVRKILSDILKLLHKSGKPKSAYAKGIGWNFSLVKRLVSGGTPVVLNLWNDGRGYYHDHTVTIIGTEEYKKNRFLLVYDNWSLGVSLIDYQKLCVISSINWVDAKA